MAVAPIEAPPDYQAMFRERILRNLRYWEAYVADHADDVPALDEERDGVIRAIYFAVELTEAWPYLRKLVTDFTPYVERRGYWDSWNRLMSQAIELAGLAGDSQGLIALSHLLARLLQRQSRFKAAISQYRQVICLARRAGDPRSEARACSNLGFLYTEMGYWWRAEVLCCAALATFEELDDDHGRAHTENHLGLLYIRCRLWEEAQGHLERACRIWQKMGDYQNVMHGYNNLGLLFNEMEQFDEAIKALEKAVDYAQQAGEEVWLGTFYMNVGISYKEKKEFRKAERYYQRAKTIFQRHSNSFGLARIQDNMGLLHLVERRWEEAGFYLKDALVAWRNLKHHYYEVQTIIFLGEYGLVKGDRHQAAAWLTEAEHLLNRYDPTNRYHDLHQRIQQFRHCLAEDEN